MSSIGRIEAQVVNINYDNPKPNDKFLVDTNVWFWFTYSIQKSNNLAIDDQPKKYQLNEYPTYLKKIKRAKSEIYRHGLSLPELLHLIEQVELKIFNFKQRSITQPEIKLKDFRHNYSQERAEVVTDATNAWTIVEHYSKPLDFYLDDNIVKKALTRFKTQELDGYDLLMVEAMQVTGITHLITDDGDYASVGGITIFTANHTLIEKAKRAGKLIKR